VTRPDVRRVRDLTLWTDGDHTYVVACDANASVGQQPNDFLQRPPEEAGYNAAKVAVMEVLAAGASPFLVTNTLCGPLDDYGTRVVDGVRRALAEIGSGALVTGSDETNMRTSQTGVGVTVLGAVPTARLRLGTSRAGDLVVCLGRPKDGVGVPYTEDDEDVSGPLDVLEALAHGAHEVLPVGSRGVSYELGQLAATAGLAARPTGEVTIDLAASAGVSTCVLASIPASSLDAFRAATTLPVEVIATLR
jgi:hypothetical protein